MTSQNNASSSSQDTWVMQAVHHKTRGR